MKQSYAFDEAKMMAGIAAYRREFPVRERPRRAVEVKLRGAYVAPRKPVPAGLPAPLQLRSQPLKRPVVDPVHVTRLIEAVEAEFGVPFDRMRARDNSRGPALARQVAMFLVRQETGASLERIGSIFSKHHTSVIYGLEMMALHVEADFTLRERIERIASSARQTQND